MSQPSTKLPFVLFTLFLAGILISIAAFFSGGCVGQTRRRIEYEHGLSLPASAANFVCRGDAWKQFFQDCGAASAFEMVSNDLPRFLAQLKIRNVHYKSEDGIVDLESPPHKIHPEWRASGLLGSYGCTSPTGSWLDVQVWRLGDGRVGVSLYTDWN